MPIGERLFSVGLSVYCSGDRRENERRWQRRWQRRQRRLQRRRLAALSSLLN